MKKSKSLLEIGAYLNVRVKELAFDNVFHFLGDCLANSTRLANDEEVSQILFETIEYGGLYVPKGIDTNRFTFERLLMIADSNFKPSYCKEKLAIEVGVHEQTINKWLNIFDNALYSKLYNERKLTFLNLFQIIDSLGLSDDSSEILSRKDLSNRCNLKPSELIKNLPPELLKKYKKFIKYPPVFSNQVLEFFEVELI